MRDLFKSSWELKKVLRRYKNQKNIEEIEEIKSKYIDDIPY